MNFKVLYLKQIKKSQLLMIKIYILNLIQIQFQNIIKKNNFKN